MPAIETLERFIARVEENAHAEAIEEFYAVDASMQENQSPPRVGRDAHIANERRIFSRMKTLTSKCVRPVFLDGDRTVIRWIFHFEWLDGTVTHMEELACQRWEGERIASRDALRVTVAQALLPAGSETRLDPRLESRDAAA